eukprot:861581-Prorocentrum_minimum.AAC.2
MAVAFSDDLDLFWGGAGRRGNTKGRISSIGVWGRNIPQSEVRAIALTNEYRFEYALGQMLAYYDLEECEGTYISDTLDAHGYRDAEGAASVVLPVINGPTWHRDALSDVLSTPGWHPWRLS